MTDLSTQTEVTTPAAVAVAPNVTLTKAEFEKHAREFGKQYGKGMNSRPAMAMEAVQAAQQLADVGPDDAESIYTIFQQAAARAKGIEYKAESSFKVQVSKLRQFLSVGALPNVDGVAVLELAQDCIREYASSQENPLKGSAYDNMVNVARAQLAQPDEPLSETQIRGILTPDVEEKTDLDRIIAIYKAVRKLGETVNNEHLETAQTEIATTITELGGEIPAGKPKDAQAKAVAALIRRHKRDQAKLLELTGQTVAL